MPLQKIQIIHIVTEVVVVTAVVIYFQVRHNQLSSKVSNLEEIIRSRDQRIAVLENVVQEILKCQPDSVKKNVSLRVRSVQNSPARLNTARSSRLKSRRKSSFTTTPTSSQSTTIHHEYDGANDVEYDCWRHGGSRFFRSRRHGFN